MIQIMLSSLRIISMIHGNPMGRGKQRKTDEAFTTEKETSKERKMTRSTRGCFFFVWVRAGAPTFYYTTASFSRETCDAAAIRIRLSLSHRTLGTALRLLSVSAWGK